MLGEVLRFLSRVVDFLVTVSAPVPVFFVGFAEVAFELFLERADLRGYAYVVFLYVCWLAVLCITVFIPIFRNVYTFNFFSLLVFGL